MYVTVELVPLNVNVATPLLPEVEMGVVPPRTSVPLPAPVLRLYNVVLAALFAVTELRVPFTVMVPEP